FLEPRACRGFRDDRKDLDRRLRDVIEHPDLLDPQPILGPINTAQALDTTLADSPGLEPQMPLNPIAHRRANMCRKSLELLDRRRSQDNAETHSGQILARRPPRA